MFSVFSVHVQLSACLRYRWYLHEVGQLSDIIEHAYSRGLTVSVQVLKYVSLCLHPNTVKVIGSLLLVLKAMNNYTSK